MLHYSNMFVLVKKNSLALYFQIMGSKHSHGRSRVLLSISISHTLSPLALLFPFSTTYIGHHHSEHHLHRLMLQPSVTFSSITHDHLYCMSSLGSSRSNTFCLFWRLCCQCLIIIACWKPQTSSISSIYRALSAPTCYRFHLVFIFRESSANNLSSSFLSCNPFLNPLIFWFKYIFVISLQ